MTEGLKFLSSSSFMPHAQCFLWQEDLLALYVISQPLKTYKLLIVMKKEQLQSLTINQ